MFALVLIRENWCVSYHKGWFVKKKEKKYMHIPAKVKSREKTKSSVASEICV